MANYIDDDCLPSLNDNITSFSLPSSSSSLHTRNSLNLTNFDFAESEIKKIEEKVILGDIFNKEFKNAVDFLHGIKPQYRELLGEINDFYLGR